MNPEYKRLIRKPNPLKMTGGFCKLHSDVKEILIEGVVQISFNRLYPNMLVDFYNEGMLDDVDSKFDKVILPIIKRIGRGSDISRNKWVSIENQDEWMEHKKWVNSIWINELRGYTNYIFDMFSQYLTMYYSDIIKNNRYSWLYIDTDTMYFTKSENIKIHDIGIPLVTTEQDNIDLIVFEKEKRFVSYSDKDLLKVRGYHPKDKHTPTMIMNLIKEKIRERRLDKILS